MDWTIVKIVGILFVTAFMMRWQRTGGNGLPNILVSFALFGYAGIQAVVVATNVLPLIANSDFAGVFGYIFSPGGILTCFLTVVGFVLFVYIIDQNDDVRTLLMVLIWGGLMYQSIVLVGEQPPLLIGEVVDSLVRSVFPCIPADLLGRLQAFEKGFAYPLLWYLWFLNPCLIQVGLVWVLSEFGNNNRRVIGLLAPLQSYVLDVSACFVAVAYLVPIPWNAMVEWSCSTLPQMHTHSWLLVLSLALFSLRTMAQWAFYMISSKPSTVESA